MDKDVQRNFGPKTPDENATGITDWHRQLSMDKKALLANGADVRGQAAPGFLLLRREREVSARFAEVNVPWQPFVVFTARFADVIHAMPFGKPRAFLN